MKLINRITWPGVACLTLIIAFTGAAAQFGWGGEKGIALVAAVCSAAMGLVGVFVKGLDENE